MINQEAMSAVRDEFRDTLLRTGQQHDFFAVKWLVFAVAALYAYGSLLCYELTSTGEVRDVCVYIDTIYICMYTYT